VAIKGEYAGWRATQASGDFDLRTFAIRAYPVEGSTGSGPEGASMPSGTGDRHERPT
jgi:hypothetical protein